MQIPGEESISEPGKLKKGAKTVFWSHQEVKIFIEERLAGNRREARVDEKQKEGVSDLE